MKLSLRVVAKSQGICPLENAIATLESYVPVAVDCPIRTLDIQNGVKHPVLMRFGDLLNISIGDFCSLMRGVLLSTSLLSLSA